MRRFATILPLAAGCLIFGCSQDDVAALRKGDAADSGLVCTIALERDVRIRDHAASSFFQAEVTLTGLPVGGSDQLHLVWLRPDGLELFRKFGVVEVATLAEGFTVRTTWKDAEDLHKAKLDETEADLPTFSTSSRLGIDEQRAPGDYTLKVYWNRELLAENSITLVEVRNATAPSADIVFCRRIGSKSGKRIEVGDRFEIIEGKAYRYVNGLVDLTDLPVDETHAFHLVWTRPDGQEISRRSGTLSTSTESGEFIHNIVWNKKGGAETTEPIHTIESKVTLASRINVDPGKKREVGAYGLCFFWDHGVLLKRRFDLIQ